MDKKEQNKSELILYQTEDGKTRLEVRLQDETVWLTQKMMADLFQTTIPNINMHIKNILDERELDRRATIKDFLIVQKEGAREVSLKKLLAGYELREIERERSEGYINRVKDFLDGYDDSKEKIDFATKKEMCG